MNNEQVILERLESIEERVRPLAESARSFKELKEDLAPRVDEAVRALIIEMQDIETDFQLEDLIFLIKKGMRNVRNFTFALEQMGNLIDFATTAEPLLKVSVPQWIESMQQLEQKGAFALLKTAVGVADKVAQTYTEEDMQQIGDGLVRLVGVAKKLTNPAAIDFLERAAEVPSQVDLSRAEPAGRWKMFWALSDPEVRQGLGVVLELTRALATVKGEDKPSLPEPSSDPAE
jgi:uncharacterized protein YjgD (DUF1641 family)